MSSIRTAARALIIENDRILTIKMQDSSGVFYILPGGGQNHGETLEETLARETLEEIGAQISIGSLAYVREYIGKNHAFRKSHKFFHQLECVFLCSLKSHEGLGGGSEHDKKQVGIEWLPINELSDHRLLPSVLKTFFKGSSFTPSALYLGDIN
jgi:ADP-ribose pyrophosphatase YjhB (NUDIX family)